MYVILVYDVNVKRVVRALKACRRYLNWVQNSVFEGYLTESKLKALQINLKKIIQEKEDSILIYTMRDERALKKLVMGVEKSKVDSFL